MHGHLLPSCGPSVSTEPHFSRGGRQSRQKILLQLMHVQKKHEDIFVCACFCFFLHAGCEGGEVITTKEAVRDLQNNCSCCLVVVPAPSSHVLNSWMNAPRLLPRSRPEFLLVWMSQFASKQMVYCQLILNPLCLCFCVSISLCLCGQEVLIAASFAIRNLDLCHLRLDVVGALSFRGKVTVKPWTEITCMHASDFSALFLAWLECGMGNKQISSFLKREI